MEEMVIFIWGKTLELLVVGEKQESRTPAPDTPVAVPSGLIIFLLLSVFISNFQIPY